VPQFRLRTLLIVMALGPLPIAVVAGLWFKSAITESVAFWFIAGVSLYAVFALWLGYGIAWIVSAFNTLWPDAGAKGSSPLLRSTLRDVLRWPLRILLGMVIYVVASGPLIATSIWTLKLTGSSFIYGPVMGIYLPLIFADEFIMGGYGRGPFETYIQFWMALLGSGPP